MRLNNRTNLIIGLTLLMISSVALGEDRVYRLTSHFDVDGKVSSNKLVGELILKAATKNGEAEIQHFSLTARVDDHAGKNLATISVTGVLRHNSGEARPELQINESLSREQAGLLHLVANQYWLWLNFPDTRESFEFPSRTDHFKNPVFEQFDQSNTTYTWRLSEEKGPNGGQLFKASRFREELLLEVVRDEQGRIQRLIRNVSQGEDGWLKQRFELILVPKGPGPTSR